jgi:transcriptional regulator with XRE-family HTH domain
MVKKNVRLKSLMFERGFKLSELAKETGIPRSYLSMGVNGRYVFSEAEQRRIAKTIGCKPEDVF